MTVTEGDFQGKYSIEKKINWGYDCDAEPISDNRQTEGMLQHVYWILGRLEEG